MSFDTSSTFARIIEDHLELKRRNAELEQAMPLERYHVEDPFENHPLFKTEEQARIEDTLGGVETEFDLSPVLAWPIEESEETHESVGALWNRSRDFDWGD